MKQAAEHAFDYVAPPPPKNIQAIAELALPASTRASSSKTKPEKFLDIGGTGGDSKAAERQPSSSADRVPRTTLATRQAVRHMAPAVAAALAKTQTSQSVQMMKRGEGHSDLQHEEAQQVDRFSFQDSISRREVFSTSSAHLQMEMQQHAAQEFKVHSSNVDEPPHIKSHHEISQHDASGVEATLAEEAVTQIGETIPVHHHFDSQSEFVRGATNSDGGKQRLKTNTSQIESRLHHVAANPLEQLVMLLDFNENRYGDDDLDAAHSQGLISTLPDMEVGGSNSHEEFMGSSNRDNYESGSPLAPKLLCLHVNPALIDDQPRAQVQVSGHLAVAAKALDSEAQVSCSFSILFFDIVKEIFFTGC